MAKTITISGFDAARFGPTWVSVQDVLRSMFNDDEAVLVRISRRDGGCNYRDTHATYDLTLVSGSNAHDIALVIQ